MRRGDRQAGADRGDRLARSARRRERRDKEADEVEEPRSAIVAEIASGLVTVAAEPLTPAPSSFGCGLPDVLAR